MTRIYLSMEQIKPKKNKIKINKQTGRQVDRQAEQVYMCESKTQELIVMTFYKLIEMNINLVFLDKYSSHVSYEMLKKTKLCPMIHYKCSVSMCLSTI